MALTPKEKWDRLNNPKTLEDYGLSVSESEMRTFPEGRQFLLGLRLHQREQKYFAKIFSTIAENITSTLDQVYIDAVTKCSKEP